MWTTSAARSAPVRIGPMPRPDERCPRCAASDQIPIVYGMPDAATGRAAARGELVIGGCVVGPDAPDRRCWACGHEWLSGVEEPPPRP